jgi:hypothetical protein
MDPAPVDIRPPDFLACILVAIPTTLSQSLRTENAKKNRISGRNKVRIKVVHGGNGGKTAERR